jgi:hypothetical protein
VAAYLVARGLYQAHSLQPAQHIGIGVIDRYGALGPDLDRFAFIEKVPLERAAGSAREVNHCLMALQVLHP